MLRFLPRRLRHRTFLTIVLVSLCVCLGWGLSDNLQPTLAQGELAQPNAAVEAPIEAQDTATVGTVDPILPKYQKGQALYLENCSTCHIALPPAVLPSQTWINLLQDQEHYGAQLPDIRAFDRQLMVRYLNNYSRSIRADERIPYRVTRARHFYALHPEVKLPRQVTVESCASCHTKVDAFDFRQWKAVPVTTSGPE